jgi:Iron-containing redox enzyme
MSHTKLKEEINLKTLCLRRMINNSHADRVIDSRSLFNIPNHPDECHTISQQLAYLLSLNCDPPAKGIVTPSTIQKALHLAIDLAFNNLDPVALLDIHKTLFEIYETSLSHPLSPICSHEHSPWLLTIRNQIESAWFNYELSVIKPQLPIERQSKDPKLLSDWFIVRSQAEADIDKQLLDFFTNNASTQQFNTFILSDAILNYRFCDALALAQIHFSETVKAEIVSNMFDEYGHGVAARSHSRQFTEMLIDLGLEQPTTAIWEDDWRPYAGHNLYFFLGLNRRHFFKSIGSLAMPELFDPNRNRSIVAGLNRLYGERKDYKFYSNHIETDEDHGSRWIDNAIAPIVKLQPEAGMELAIGGALRMESMRRYNEYLFERLGVAQLDR